MSTCVLYNVTSSNEVKSWLVAICSCMHFRAQQLIMQGPLAMVMASCLPLKETLMAVTAD